MVGATNAETPIVLFRSKYLVDVSNFLSVLDVGFVLTN